MAYYGNLALRPERVEEQRPQQAARQQTVRPKATKRRSIPIGEKLLYMFAIVLVVFVAGFVILRYAQIYQINGQVQAATKAYNQATEKAKEYTQQIEQLSDPERIKNWAKAKGYVELTDGIKVTAKNDQSAVAKKP